MFSMRHIGLAAGLWMFAVIHSYAAQPEVDTLLVLAPDVSGSITKDKFELQRNGYVSAITNPRVVRAMTSGPTGRIGLVLAEWSDPGQFKVIVDWTIIDSIKAAEKFAAPLAKADRPFTARTSISWAIEASVSLLDNAPFTAPRRIVDISGDGTNNRGRDLLRTRDAALARGVTINGLVILTQPSGSFDGQWWHTNPGGGLEKYYERNVIGGPGAFVEIAKDFNTFGDALSKKMITEIAENGRVLKNTFANYEHRGK